MTSSIFGVFGYGSLVNSDTLRTSYISVHRARVRGWRRQWLRRPEGFGDFALAKDLAFLSASPNENDGWMDGMIVLDSSKNLPALDEREMLYDRIEMEHSDVEWLDEIPDSAKSAPLYIYSAPSEPAGQDLRILRSYLDAVLQGYHRAFGEDGVVGFLATTTPAGLEIWEDRATPLYPRSVVLTATETEVIDRYVPLQI
ncbi:MAG: gamma-glutamylcyclotransferase family protein [Pseudomonadota bacterium]